MPPIKRSDDERDDDADRSELRRLQRVAMERLTMTVEELAINVAVLTERIASLDVLWSKFSDLEKSYSELQGALKTQAKVFTFISGLLITIIGGLIVAYFKKP